MALSACEPAASSSATTTWERDWVYTDLRAYDPVDAPDPSADLVAISTRNAGNSLQVRLDWLDLDLQPDIDIYLALDTSHGGIASLPIRVRAEMEWESLIIITASHAIKVLDGSLEPLRGLSVNVTRNPQLGEIEIQLRGAILPSRYPGVQLQVFVTKAGSTDLADAGPVIDTNQPSPPPTGVLFAFWNTFPAYTPAQALRRWDGAHTGPFGGRHGLYNLLRAFRNRGLPLALLDLKWPPSLSALDYAGGLPLVRDMARNGLLILPETLPAQGIDPQEILPDWVQARAAVESRQTAQRFDLPASQFLTAPLGDGLPENYAFVFIPQSGLPSLEPVATLRRGRQRILSIPGYGISIQVTVQASPDGPSLELRRALASAAYNPATSGTPEVERILVLGGELPANAWGEPASAAATLDYLIHKPWIRILGANDLLAQQPAAPAAVSLAAQPDSLLEAMRGLPPSILSEVAWQTYLALQEPVYPAPPELFALRKVYRIQVEILLDAVRWEASCATGPCVQSVVRCDPTQRCILASAHWYAVADLRTGGLLYLFYRAQDGQVHEIIGPTSQLVVGQSDPAAWQLDRGLSADPAVIPGGLADDTGPYQSFIDSEKLTLVSSGGHLRKSYRLGSDRFLVEIESLQLIMSHIPLILDPWRRLAPGWGKLYQGGTSTDGWHWGLALGPQVVVHTNGRLTVQEFTASQEAMGRIEDPNFDFQPGHYVDFPVALLEVQADNRLTLEFQLLP